MPFGVLNLKSVCSKVNYLVVMVFLDLSVSTWRVKGGQWADGYFVTPHGVLGPSLHTSYDFAARYVQFTLILDIYPHFFF